MGERVVSISYDAYERGGETHVEFREYNSEAVPEYSTYVYIYTFDRENAAKLTSFFRKEYEGTLKEMIDAAFEKMGNRFSIYKICKENDITFTGSHGVIV